MDQIGYPLRGDFGEKPVTVSYPTAGSEPGPWQDIVGRGGLPLLIGNYLLAEVPQGDIEESWHTAESMSDAEAGAFCLRAANRLARAFDSEIASADLPDLVANAAVLFLLSLKQAGIRSTGEIKPCTVTYDGRCERGKVERAA